MPYTNVISPYLVRSTCILRSSTNVCCVNWEISIIVNIERSIRSNKLNSTRRYPYPCILASSIPLLYLYMKPIHIFIIDFYFSPFISNFAENISNIITIDTSRWSNVNSYRNTSSIVICRWQIAI